MENSVMGALLGRGMLAGFFAACLASLVAIWLGEPQIDQAIQFETAHAKAAHQHTVLQQPVLSVGKENSPKGEPVKSSPEGEGLVSRGVQKSIGLFVAVAVYGVAFGGIFSIGFALLYGRIFGNYMSVRMLSLILALGGFAVFVLVPEFKYPANPPAIGLEATIGIRTAGYFEMLLFSVCSAILSGVVTAKIRSVISLWNSVIVGGAVFVVLVSLLQLALPSISEVPADFSATVLWQFRIASLAMQATLWLSLGLVFGIMAERVLVRQTSRLSHIS